MKVKSMITVLDKGYVRLISNMGSDLDVVNAARVSYDKEVSELSTKDERLIEFLIRERHDSTLRHCTLTFEVYAPLMVARQWYKHAVSSTYLDDQNGWNESSRRYVTEEPEFYLPEVWRTAPENKKQGSGDNASKELSKMLTERMDWHMKESLNLYNQAMNLGIAPEQARLFLPAYSLYVRWRWTTSLNAVLHFISLRDASEAQSEIREYGVAVRDIVSNLYPLTTHYWSKHRG